MVAATKFNRMAKKESKNGAAAERNAGKPIPRNAIEQN